MDFLDFAWGGGSGEGVSFVPVYWLGVGLGRAGRCYRWLGLPPAATGEQGGTCEVKRGRGAVVGIPRTPTILQSCGLGVSPSSLQASFPRIGVGRGLLASFPAH